MGQGLPFLEGAILELYDVKVLAGIEMPMAVSLGSPEAGHFITF